MTKLKLLVVDDEVDFAEFVADVAENMDFNVISTADPTEVETLFLQDWNIIVLDLFMPHIDGIELLRLLSKSKSSASIVLMSGKDKGVLNSAQKIAEEQEITVLGVLQKPFFAKQLEVVLAKYVDQSFKRKQGSFLLPSAQQISSAIENKELFLVYQPQINITNRKIIGVEALVRWKHPVRGLIPPGIFIPIAEDNDLIKDISTFVTKTSIRQQAEWSRNGINLRMSINMSPKILTDLDMPEKLSSCVNEMGADIKNIVIEVTETALMSDVVRYMDILARLKMKGFNLSIDDFGTGYSSLQQLIRAPFNELKIDQAFIKNLDTDEECKTITEISIMLAHKLGMTVVAEGIETESVWNILRQLKCDEGQGYWMAKPMLPEEIEAWKQNWDKT
ncbi:MAG: EAL domain-containing protein (putative c-di-GMP-specific phosphodiesterase class I)/AmiR [Colwellia sp.]|jgi:EAL domain-containing protein (putative c-di-GMP-specific phosphodiesterase class I)/AmiR/NasT family two-component response regulator